MTSLAALLSTPLVSPDITFAESPHQKMDNSSELSNSNMSSRPAVSPARCFDPNSAKWPPNFGCPRCTVRQIDPICTNPSRPRWCYEVPTTADRNLNYHIHVSSSWHSRNGSPPCPTLSNWFGPQFWFS